MVVVEEMDRAVMDPRQVRMGVRARMAVTGILLVDLAVGMARVVKGRMEALETMEDHKETMKGRMGTLGQETMEDLKMVLDQETMEDHKKILDQETTEARAETPVQEATEAQTATQAQEAMEARTAT
jgi:hypothetical protein